MKTCDNLNNILQGDKTEMGEKLFSIEDYFASENHKLIFALIYTDKSLRENLLGISEELYLDEGKAKEWRNSISKKIHPDTCKIYGADNAFMKLNELYAHMTAITEEDGGRNE